MIIKRIMTWLLVFTLCVTGDFYFNIVEVKANPYAGGYSNCTWTAWQICYNETGHSLPAWSNANTWLDSAQSCGYTTSITPREKSIAVWYDGGLGHVGYVSAVSGDQIYVKEGGYSGGYHEGWLPSSGYRKNTNQYIAGYIYIPGENTPTYHNPEGNIDGCEGGDGKFRITGWAIDRDTPSQSIGVHIYLGGPAGTPGAEIFCFDANLPREDVNNGFLISGNHGFDVTYSTNKTGEQTLYVYAINSGEGNNPLIGTRTINITAYNPEGNLEECEGREGSIYVAGWAFDRSDNEKSLKIDVFIGGNKGDSNTEKHTFIADFERKDVNNAFVITGKYGFCETIATQKRGNQDVFVYVENIGAGNDLLLGYKKVLIKDITENNNTEQQSTIQSIKKQKITTAKIKTYKAKSLKKKKVTFSLKAKTTGNGKLKYAVYTCSPSKNTKYIKVSKKGKVTIKKGAKKGTYRIIILATETSKYMYASKIVKIKIK